GETMRARPARTSAAMRGAAAGSVLSSAATGTPRGSFASKRAQRTARSWCGPGSHSGRWSARAPPRPASSAAARRPNASSTSGAGHAARILRVEARRARGAIVVRARQPLEAVIGAGADLAGVVVGGAPLERVEHQRDEADAGALRHPRLGLDGRGLAPLRRRA